MDIQVRSIGTHEFLVTTTEGHLTTTHRVEVSEDWVDQFVGVDEDDLVREAVAEFLDYEKAVALPEDVTLDWLAERVPNFVDELTVRLA